MDGMDSFEDVVPRDEPVLSDRARFNPRELANVLRDEPMLEARISFN